MGEEKISWILEVSYNLQFLLFEVAIKFQIFSVLKLKSKIRVIRNICFSFLLFNSFVFLYSIEALSIHKSVSGV